MSGDNCLGLGEFVQSGSSFAFWTHWLPTAIWGFGAANKAKLRATKVEEKGARCRQGGRYEGR
ncbi:hypothetical protein PG996_016086 [Apiospora saccharicola]|uniref:Uncharacterized protein n=1 Tax=Apiospora saccharicola TaxID=335842 RepID=A0ABR1TNJ0_9PEZI